MRAVDVADIFEKIAPVKSGIQSDRDAGFLGFAFGDRFVEVTGVGVAWFLSSEVVETAVRKKMNMLIIHEPELFRSYNSPWHTCMNPMTIPYNIEKARPLTANGITVYTAHSNWDLQPQVGMLPTFAKHLKLGKMVKRDSAVGIFQVPETTFGELCRRIKQSTGLEMMRVQGEPAMPVRRIMLGFGSMGFVVDGMIANEVDVGIFGELREWSFIAAREAGLGIIETTHLVSESIGFRSVVVALKKKIRQVPVEFIDIPFPYKYV